MRQAIEGDEATTVTDPHVWSIGPGKYAAIIVVVTKTLQSADDVKAMLLEGLPPAHATVGLNGFVAGEPREGSSTGHADVRRFGYCR